MTKFIKIDDVGFRHDFDSKYTEAQSKMIGPRNQQQT
nr:MAG TPA: hypothetical protein [Caudoviricetes sp.]